MRRGKAEFVKDFAVPLRTREQARGLKLRAAVNTFMATDGLQRLLARQ